MPATHAEEGRLDPEHEAATRSSWKRKRRGKRLKSLLPGHCKEKSETVQTKHILKVPVWRKLVNVRTTGPTGQKNAQQVGGRWVSKGLCQDIPRCWENMQ